MLHIPCKPLVSRALWYEAAGHLAIRSAPLDPPREGQSLVRTLWSAVSRGTECLVLEGSVPQSEYHRMRAPFQDGAFPFPVKYGYCNVGRVEIGPEHLLGHCVFSLFPHQDVFVLANDALTCIPPSLPPRRATLAANMETALNALWDSDAGAGDRIVVIGAGTIGLLVAYLAARLPGAEVIISDLDPTRRLIALSLGLDFRLAGEDALPIGQADVVFHASSSAHGLEAALHCAGPEANVVELSWYGKRRVHVSLGDAFHSQRLRLIASQVGQIAPSRRARWDYARRLSKAMDLLYNSALDVLLTNEIAFEQAPDALTKTLAPDAKSIGTILRY